MSPTQWQGTLVFIVIGCIVIGSVILIISAVKRRSRSKPGAPLRPIAPPPQSVPKAPVPPASAARTCQACGAVNAADEKFCGECGKPLQ
jgi:hypothetical protein